MPMKENHNDQMNKQNTCDPVGNRNKIIIADDQKINLEAIRMNLESIGITENLCFCSDGQAAIEIALSLLNNAINEFKGKRLRPIRALLLDVQMPLKTGIQVVEAIKSYCTLQNGKVIEPKYIFLTAFISQNF